MDKHEVIEAARKRAEQTTIFEHPAGFAIILAHPGQELNRDPKALRENFGIMPEHLDRVKLMSESDEHRPLTEAEKALIRAGDVDARIAELEKELEELKASKASAGGRARKADGVESSPAKE